MRKRQASTRPGDNAGSGRLAGVVGGTLPGMAPITIDEALSRFLDTQRERLAPHTFRNYDDVIGLLRDCMNGYGPNLLSGADHDRWRRTMTTAMRTHSARRWTPPTSTACWMSSSATS